MKKIKLIYIVGHGYSGSTILSLLLGSSSNAFSFGEKSSLRKNIQERKDCFCDCGKRYQDCVIWGKLFKCFKDHKYYLLQLRILLSSLLGNWIIKDIINEEKCFFNKVSNIIDSVKPGSDIFIDSSKNPIFYLLLQRVPNIDIQVINLVKDGRGVIYSRMKRKNRFGSNIFSAYVIWLFWNITIKLILIRTPSNKKLYISYDKCITNINKYIDIFNEKFNLCIEKENYIDAVNNNENHNMGGNGLRNKKFTGITYHQKRKKQLTRYKKTILSALCYLPNKIWVK